MLLEEDRIELKANDLLYYPSGIKYFLRSDKLEPMVFITVNFDFTDEYPGKEVLPPVYEELYDPSLEQPTHKYIENDRFIRPFVVENADFGRLYLSRLLELAKSDGEYGGELSSAILKCLIYEIVNASGVRKGNEAINSALRFIHSNYAGKLDNSAIAAAVGYHPYHLGRLFKLHVGKTLAKYLQDVRLEHAEELLMSTDLTVVAISDECGFTTAEHLIKVFKRRYGTTPLKWRKNRNLV
jgi:AraC-like DNA-binding protein